MSKIPLVLLHGIFGGLSNWEGIIPFLPPTCQPIPLELPFFSEEKDLSSVTAVIEYVQSFIDKEGLKSMVLLGNSIGGHIAARLALDNPQSIKGLILTGSSGLFERSFTKIPGARPDRSWVREKACEVFFDSVHVTEKMVDEIMTTINDRKKARKLLQLAKSAKRDNIADRLKLIQCPTLLIWGKQDLITPPEVAEQFHSLLPNSEIAWIDSCGHAPMMECPKEFTKHLISWCHKYFLTEQAIV